MLCCAACAALCVHHASSRGCAAASHTPHAAAPRLPPAVLYPFVGRWWCSVCPFMVVGEQVGAGSRRGSAREQPARLAAEAHQWAPLQPPDRHLPARRPCLLPLRRCKWSGRPRAAPSSSGPSSRRSATAPPSCWPCLARSWCGRTCGEPAALRIACMPLARGAAWSASALQAASCPPHAASPHTNPSTPLPMPAGTSTTAPTSPAGCWR